MRINCHAKINIGLEILNKRPDNYHNINTIFYKINLFDELIIEENDAFEFICSPELNIPNEENLAYKATLALRDAFHLKTIPAKFTLVKNIPSGAGLGGGSSDAAGVLQGLIEFLGLDDRKKQLSTIGLMLGSDVPFFIGEKNAAIGRGRGEMLEFFDFVMPYHILLIFPGIHVSTADAYKSLNRGNIEQQATDFSAIQSVINDNPEEMNRIFVNQFEEYVFRQHPQLATIKNQLLKYGAFYASMSGSGSTVYGIFKEGQAAFEAQDNLSMYNTFINRPDVR